MKQDFSDIIHLDRPKSKHPKMSIYDRSAQFSPFAALTGHDEAIRETARRTQKKRLLSKEQVNNLNLRLHFLMEHMKEIYVVTITYFEEDAKKSGGTYITKTTMIAKIDTYERYVKLDDGTKIKFIDLYEIAGDCFEEFNE